MSTSAGVPDGVCDGGGASGQSCFTLRQSHLPAAPHKLRKLSTPVPESLLSKVNYLNRSVSLPPVYASQEQSTEEAHNSSPQIWGRNRWD